MSEKPLEEWVKLPGVKRILLLFSFPKTPKTAEQELGIKKLNLRPFLEKGLLMALNPDARKGRLYVLTDRARKLLGVSSETLESAEQKDIQDIKGIDWHLIGRLIGSPRYRLSVFRTVAMDSKKRTSEDIRKRAARHNPALTRICTKAILKELIDTGLVETEKDPTDRKRYYWLSEKGRSLIPQLHKFFAKTFFEKSF